MSSGGYTHHGYYPTPSQPIAMPSSKDTMPIYGYEHFDYSQISSSPPEGTDVSSVSGPSFDPSATSASYAASASDYEAANNAISSVDLLEFMNDRLQSSYNPIEMDRSLVQQVQTSGELNAKQYQLLEMQALMQQKMATLQASMAPNIKKAKKIQQDLDWTQKKVKSLNKKAARKYAEEYAMATERYPIGN